VRYAPEEVACGEEADDRRGVGWGLVLAPACFGAFREDLPTGNFGDRRISAFDSAAGAFLGQLHDPTGHPVTITGWWVWPAATAAWPAGTTTLWCAAGPATTPEACSAPSSPHSTDGVLGP
jgi:hypothetical protein